mgnify:CR=1 FL=1
MLQKNVLDYLDSSAARFPHKLAFADEARSFTFGQLRACARGLGTALADLGPQHNRPVAVLVNHTAANLAAFFGVLEAGHFYVPLDLQMPLPRLRGILETLSPAALVYPAGEETLAQALAAAGLIDRYEITVIPTLLGGGVPLFGALEQEQKLRLLGTGTSNGMAELIYVPR